MTCDPDGNWLPAAPLETAWQILRKAYVDQGYPMSPDIDLTFRTLFFSGAYALRGYMRACGDSEAALARLLQTVDAER